MTLRWGLFGTATGIPSVFEFEWASIGKCVAFWFLGVTKFGMFLFVWCLGVNGNYSNFVDFFLGCGDWFWEIRRILTNTKNLGKNNERETCLNIHVRAAPPTLLWCVTLEFQHLSSPLLVFFFPKFHYDLICLGWLVTDLELHLISYLEVGWGISTGFQISKWSDLSSSTHMRIWIFVFYKYKKKKLNRLKTESNKTEPNQFGFELKNGKTYIVESLVRFGISFWVKTEPKVLLCIHLQNDVCRTEV